MKIQFFEGFQEDLDRVAIEAVEPDEVLSCIDKAIQEIIKHPEHAAILKEPPLIGFRKKKFHSNLHPQEGFKPDLRLIYSYDSKQELIYIFGCGYRKLRSKEDVYEFMNQRIMGETKE
ncbi:hypothetical protein [Desmospora profundinema]|uniref:mRNA-degrading endonuclease YafQ of YafQ-DinJ toxin-antitoxin module n=1 Tax=Desmospora profundinema TaxID=1571184 RepID=A0ABU1IN24_9BACL|nr:hypothetical protein [Desmospora profundinema]MDR6226185.1 mRNA-degrading endonuclease YafQ of YafQ-DinJ toxin-antitoxin module [Desmospora profundinema]